MWRSWWLRGLLFSLLVGAAVVALMPTVIPYDHQPELIRRYFHRAMRPSVALVGGLRLEYEVDVETAISMRTDSVARALEQILHDEHPRLRLEVEREGGADVLVSAPRLVPELAYPKLMKASGGWLVEVERDAGHGRIRLRFDPAKRAEVREAAIRTGLAAIDSLMDASHCWGERVTREGDRIVLELPGAGAAQAARTKTILRGQRALRLVDDEPTRRFAGSDASPGAPKDP